MRFTATILFMLVFSINTYADKIFIKAAPLSVKETSWAPNCDDCWNSLYIYKIKVLDVIEGELKDKTINVTMLAHSPYNLDLKEYKTDWYLVLDEMDLSKEWARQLAKEHKVKYEVIDQSFPRKYICFNQKLDTQLKNKDLFETDMKNEEGDRYCYLEIFFKKEWREN